MAFYELRQYVVRPGKMEAWLKLMEEEIISRQTAVGMIISGSFRGEEDDSVYVWLRRFESEAERERLYKEFYESDVWVNELTDQVGQLIEREKIMVQRIVPTPLSVLK
ncbi:MAG: NIPSNAP family containing protein [Rhodobacteraceae bacterium]|nr:NIPSNAP family containing protein [Paracoccaceae bacterium]